MHRPQLKTRSERFFEDMDYRLLIPALLLTVIGLYVMQIVNQAGYGGTYPGNFIKQLAACLVGVLLALVISLLDLPTLKLMAWFVYGISVLLLIYVKIDSFSLAAETGADSWMRIPLFGTFQPSELAKVGIAMLASLILSRIDEGEITLLKGICSLVLIYGIPMFLIYREPDFGTTLVIVVMFLTSIFVWGIDWKLLIAMAFGGVGLFFFLWNFSFSPYMKNRILSLIFPSQDLVEGFHLDQALQAIASGGLVGNRTGRDVYVPVKESDFIFTAVGEYLGLIGTTTVLILIACLLLRAIRVSERCREIDSFSSFLMISLTGVMAFHFIENIGMNVGLLPITGIPLPFMSSGGTSMVVNYISLGIMLNISMEYQSYGD